jgi:general secretion pathway protein L
MATAIENQIQNIRSRLQGSQLAHFLRWWGGELRELLPAELKARMQHARRRVIMQLQEQELQLSVVESGAIVQLDALSLKQDSRLQKQQLYDLLNERELSEVPRDILLPEGRVLRKVVFLPLAAEANLAQALAFEMDRQTPFQADAVFFDYRILQRDRDAAQLKLELIVSQREPLNRDVQTLTALGLPPSGADVQNDGLPAGVNLLPLEMRHRIINSRSRFNMLLAGAAAVLLAVTMAQSLWLKQHQINEVQVAIDEVREEAMLVQDIRTRISDASEAAGFLYERRAAATPTVKVMAEVTRVLPDDTYLDRLLVGVDTVQMQGKSDNAQQLIELVNQSELFSDASFRGPTRLDSRTQKEIFDLTATLQNGEAE